MPENQATVSEKQFRDSPKRLHGHSPKKPQNGQKIHPKTRLKMSKKMLEKPVKNRYNQDKLTKRRAQTKGVNMQLSNNFKTELKALLTIIGFFAQVFGLMALTWITAVTMWAIFGN